MTVDRGTETSVLTDRALDAMARIVRDWDATAYEVAEAEDSSELRRERGGHDGLGVYSYRPWITDQDIDLLRRYVEAHKPPVDALFYTLLEAVSERFDLDSDQAIRFVSESCSAGGLANPDEQPELVEQLRNAARHEPAVGWLLKGPDRRGA